MTIREIREENLKYLIKKVGKKSTLAEMADTNAAYISQVLSKKTKRSIGDALARKLEQACDKERGWLDTIHTKEGEKKQLSETINHLNLSEPSMGYSKTSLHKIPLFEFNRQEICININSNHKMESYVITPEKFGENSFAIKIKNNTITKIANIGDYIVFDPDFKKIPGKNYLISINGSLEISLYRKISGEEYFDPGVNGVQPIKITPQLDYEIIAIAVYRARQGEPL